MNMTPNETEAQRIEAIKKRNRALYEPIPPIPAPTPPAPAKQARQAATVPAKAPTFTTAEKIAALRQQDPGLSFEEAARKVSATDPAQYQAEMGTAPVTATPEAATPAETAPEGNAYLDRMRALQAEGLPVHTAALQAAKERPEAFKRLKGEL
ncbi:MAG: hypothetical protein GX580_07465, partial [Candidatus Hydrogenedens sp.]|nr:hypothetical protein [Candidatus Hydrogenedens sp.]